MNFLSTSNPSPSTSKLNTTSLHPHPPKQSPTLSHLVSNSASPSPTSSTSSYLSYFDNRSFGGERRESACSNTSWGSMGETPSSKPPDKEDISMEEEKPINPRMISDKSINSVFSSGSGSSSSSSPDPKLSTPELSSSTEEKNPPFLAAPNGVNQISPSSSTASKGECTPRAEIPPPVWPHTSSSSPARKSDYYEEPSAMASTGDESKSSTTRKPSLRRNGSWRRKHASLDSPPTAPHLDPGFPGFTALKHTPPLGPAISAPAPALAPSQPPSLNLYTQPEGRLAPPQSTNGNGSDPNSPDVRRLSDESFRSNGSGSSIIAQSPTTGCEISAPKAPPAGYPLPSVNGMQRRFSVPDQFPSPSSSTSMSTTSTSASSSSSSSNRSNSNKSPNPLPPPPRWACPPAKTNAVSGRALSFGSSQDRPDVSFDDFDPELFEGSENEWIEIIKGAEGRIAIKSTPHLYDIMVWLPGFSLDNITIATRGTRTIHIVADQWDEGDHAQWDIKLGEDANLKSVNAKFTGKELRVTVAREQRFTNPRLMRMSSSNRPSFNSAFSAPSITASSGHNPLERATVTR
ncbi:hypothetical protein L486_05897 [Kwoniella mangroviensis CBS 10435]|uniref:SHSP domain-containing protein n=1 Tax=Kwoniella mangroviensis CBS 10435 TaxID=1331196 RepID=A0A1B9INU5_9TREE|nr:hypothetical protein L486_05897 [Kwoniella mangroviensis CBS 10435]